ncbi:hypothetical protein BDB00DRAFT_901884 [Zychaea mexicana]|uniref:uncharacterized protein n=1 Tax=Zychaea mexicana TaxID=64656 RepID=UPI0022FEDAC8|nr:uncharacterized protein BDB00DRAFT_901884 [Zychaea mexicana]KAI9467999.1 hypothetical protein BDB00DRAFT_901884 [Zychaea mexicana]
MFHRLPSFKNMVKAREVSYLAPNWSAQLVDTMVMGSIVNTSKGYLRGNPLILKYKDFRRQLAQHLSSFFNTLDPTLTAREHWEQLKSVLKKQMQRILPPTYINKSGNTLHSAIEAQRIFTKQSTTQHPCWRCRHGATHCPAQ